MLSGLVTDMYGNAITTMQYVYNQSLRTLVANAEVLLPPGGRMTIIDFNV